ncbi:MAG: HD domain-containing protein, partial [Candidatus Binatia bacterium]
METAERARFTRMDEGSAEDWAIIAQKFLPFAGNLADRVLGHLELLKGDHGGFAVDRYAHSLQTATRALRGGEDEEYVVCALLHDVGDLLTPWQHADAASVILRPFVSEENHWMVQHHPVFQGYYFFHYLGGDRNVREKYRGHPWFERTALFCEKYD